MTSIIKPITARWNQDDAVVALGRGITGFPAAIRTWIEEDGAAPDAILDGAKYLLHSESLPEHLTQEGIADILMTSEMLIVSATLPALKCSNSDLI